MSNFAEAVQRAQAMAAAFNPQSYQPSVARAALSPGDYRLKPRGGLFTCKRCDVSEMNPPNIPDHFTAWPCWFCGQDDMTLPRPIPEPAETEKAPS